MGENIRQYRKRLIREAVARARFSARAAYADRWGNARRGGQEWTLGELGKLAALKDLPAGQAGARLGRSLYGVRNARARYGRG